MHTESGTAVLKEVDAICTAVCTAVQPAAAAWRVLLLCFGLLVLHFPLEPQSRFGDKPLKFQVVCPPNGTSVLKGLKTDRAAGVDMWRYYVFVYLRHATSPPS